ncbi:unnamed protein product [Echinostoma caproni]|uniref:GST C-terminal domain-containing protein n=1 Tax=Echinostoma caproni TaxID=27848 RepID=A0A183AI55_9TREM|nr:unnamed protein product [Echinostoma caproni]
MNGDVENTGLRLAAGKVELTAALSDWTRRSVTHVDFMVYEALDVIKYLQPNCLDKFTNLAQFMSRIEALPNIKAYLESNRFIKWPLNGWSAHFGGGDAPPS